MDYSKEFCEKIGNFFYKKYNEFGGLKAEVEVTKDSTYVSAAFLDKYKEFLRKNNIQEFSQDDFYLCINQKTENDIIVFRKDYKSVSTTVSGWSRSEVLTTSISSNHTEKRIYILVPKEFAEKIFILEKLGES